MNNFSENLKKIRKDNNLSQEQLAETLGVSRQAISKWESGIAYPEMDKIITICQKFKVNIDDLLNNDIREVKNEEITKNNLNNHIDSFLNFITDSINLFSSMSFKSKIKCLLEQVIIGFILFCIAMIAEDLLENLVYSIFQSFSDKTIYIARDITSSLFYLLAIIASLIVLVHIFKTRYLDYYIKVKDNISTSDTNKNEEKISLNEHADKIIIRDPKNSEYRFIRGLCKCVVIFLKAVTIFILIFFCLLLISIFASLIISFAFIKSSIFIGTVVSLASFGVLTIIIVLFLLNFIFNRKNDKKKMIWSFIISIIVLGIGIGLILIASLKMNVIESKNNITDTYKLKMSDDLFFLYEDITFVEKNISDAEIEYTINKSCDVIVNMTSDHGIYLYSSCSNPMELIREFTNGFNNNEIILIDDNIYDIKVYASRKNIEKMKQNYKYYIDNVINGNKCYCE